MFLVRSYTPCGLRVRIWDSGFGTLELDENENLDEDRTDAAWNHERVSHGLGLERVPNLGTTLVFGRDLLDDPHQDITVQVVENPVFRPRLF